MAMQKDYYKTLGLQVSASHEEIKRAFHRLAKLYHPDITGGNSGYAELFKEVNEAYQVLSDLDKKMRYDLGLTNFIVIPKVTFDPYLVAQIKKKEVLLNDEFEISFRYIGEGRIFRKPENRLLVYLSSPVVEHRMIPAGNGEVKETSLTYTVCAMDTGKLDIPEATIYINHKLFASDALSIEVKENTCYFKSDQTASVKPYLVYLNKEREVTTNFRRIFIYRQLVPIPRSAFAYYYHQIGASLKIIFTIVGLLLAVLYDFNWVTGIIGGSLAGGLILHSMYLLTGVKSKFYHALKYATVVKYLEDNYRPGRDPSYGIFAEKAFYIFMQMLR
jgi:DnaJ domain/BatD DUF11 like domain